jgi:glutathione S-transferase
VISIRAFPATDCRIGSVAVLLYDSMVSGNCYKVRLLCAHLGLPLELRELSVVDRSDRAEVIGDLNPALRVPTLVLDDGRALGESGAICWYLGEGTRFVPDDAYERAQVLQWMFFEQYDHEPAIAVARFWLAYSGRPASGFAAELPAKHAAGYRALDAMERHLASRDWFVGGRMTLADIALYAYTHVAEEGAFDLSRYPAIGRWLARVAAEPAHVPIGG